MNTTIEALQNLYTVLGGTASEVAEITTIPDMINAIAGLSSVKASGTLSINEDDELIIASENTIKLQTGDELQVKAYNDISISGEGAISMNATGGNVDI